MQIGLGEFNKGNRPGELPPAYPLAKLPDYECEFTSPRIASNPISDEPTVTYADLLEVIEVVAETKSGELWPKKFAAMHDLSDEPTEVLQSHGIITAMQLAELVDMDHPSDLWKLITKFLTVRAARRVSYNYRPFLEQTVANEIQAMSTIGLALEAAFNDKWFYGQARPEELAGFNFTITSGGCPTHPAGPAGHGAVAAATKILIYRQWRLSVELAEMVALTCRQFAHGRSFCGYHFAEDNDNGLYVGAATAKKVLV